MKTKTAKSKTTPPTTVTETAGAACDRLMALVDARRAELERLSDFVASLESVVQSMSGPSFKKAWAAAKVEWFIAAEAYADCVKDADDAMMSLKD